MIQGLIAYLLSLGAPVMLAPPGGGYPMPRRGRSGVPAARRIARRRRNRFRHG